MIFSHVSWKFKRIDRLTILIIGEGEDVETEKFIWVDLRNLVLIAKKPSGKIIPNKNSYRYKMSKNMHIYIGTSIKFENEEDINNFMILSKLYLL